MKIRQRATKMDDVKRRGRVCPCCSRLNWKCRSIDRQVSKEALSDVRFYADEASKDYLLV